MEHHRAHIERAHRQTLERLAERGGLDILELVAALDGWPTCDRGRYVEACERLPEIVRQWQGAT